MSQHKQFTPIAEHTRTFLIRFAGIFLLALTLSCGKVGAPVPPSRLTERASQLTAIQRGNVILLSWPVPRLVRDDTSNSYIERVDIYRLAENRDEEPTLDTEDYETSAQVIHYLDRATIEAQIADGGRLHFNDVIDLNRSGSLANIRLRYAVRYVNRRGQPAAFSQTVAVEPLMTIAQPPAGLAAKDESQDTVKLIWNPPTANTDGSGPASVVGYNIYRRTARREGFGRPINSDPVTETSFADRNFQYQTEYVYVVRTLSQGTRGLIESADSESVTFTPSDKFLPAPPDPVTIASANAIISLFWPTSSESDVIGYNLYRAESPDTDEKSWSKLNAQPLTTLTYRDDRVSLGKRYYYRITAVDRFSNESAPSRVVNETANP